MPLEVTPFDPTRYIDSEEAIAAFLSDALEEGDPAAIRHALGVVARARGITQFARDIGMTREGLYKPSARPEPRDSTLWPACCAR